MYTALLTVHSYVRWVVLVAVVIVLLRALTGMVTRRPWARADDVAVRVFSTSLDIQLLIGLIIYIFLSPFTSQVWSDFGAAMRDAPTRLIMIEHQFGMIVAVALTHIARGRLRKTADLVRRHRTALIFFAVIFVLMMASIPWPGRPGGRPLFRGFGEV